MIWRQSSLPMEPPPPVTSTILSCRYSEIWALFSWISSRERKSAVFSSRRPATTGLPLSSTAWGSLSMRTRQWVELQRLMTSRRRSPFRVVMAMTISTIWYLRTSSGISEMVPRTGTPCTRRFFLVRSSSTMTTGLPKVEFLVLHRLTAQAPALPAPTMSSGVLSRARRVDLGELWVYCRTVRMSRHRKRTPATAAVLSTAPMISTVPLMVRVRNSISNSKLNPVARPDRHIRRARSRMPAYSHMISYRPPNQNTTM